MGCPDDPQTRLGELEAARAADAAYIALLERWLRIADLPVPSPPVDREWSQ